jgi:hypothetical protein
LKTHREHYPDNFFSFFNKDLQEKFENIDSLIKPSQNESNHQEKVVNQSHLPYIQKSIILVNNKEKGKLHSELSGTSNPFHIPSPLPNQMDMLNLSNNSDNESSKHIQNGLKQIWENLVLPRFKKFKCLQNILQILQLLKYWRA